MKVWKAIPWLAFLVFAFLCVLVAGLQLRTTVKGRALDKTMTYVVEPSATLELTNTSSVQPSLTLTMVPTETETPTNTLIPIVTEVPKATFTRTYTNFEATYVAEKTKASK